MNTDDWTDSACVRRCDYGFGLPRGNLRDRMTRAIADRYIASDMPTPARRKAKRIRQSKQRRRSRTMKIATMATPTTKPSGNVIQPMVRMRESAPDQPRTAAKKCQAQLTNDTAPKASKCHRVVGRPRMVARQGDDQPEFMMRAALPNAAPHLPPPGKQAERRKDTRTTPKR